MRLKELAFIPTILLGLIFSRASYVGPGNLDLKADLVAVVNMNPANPGGGEIWLMNLDGRLVQRITNNNYHEEYPSFSPGGTKILFVRNMGGGVAGVGLDPKYNEIFVYDLRTGTETRLTRNNVDDGHPEWSYDGKYILFYSRRNHPEGKAALWIMEPDGSHPRQILPLQPGDFSHLDPSWAPDGVWLTFVNQREEGDVRHSRIEKVRMDGTQRTVISSGGKRLKPSKLELGDTEPAYSPDGTVIGARAAWRVIGYVFILLVEALTTGERLRSVWIGARILMESNKARGSPRMEGVSFSLARLLGRGTKTGKSSGPTPSRRLGVI